MSSRDGYYEEALAAFSPAKLLDDAGMHSVAQISYLRQKFVYKDRLTAIDALKNSLALCSTTLGIYLAYVVGMLVLLVLTFAGGSWSGVIAFLVFLLFAPIVALSPLAVWLAGFFQPCSPGYALTWLIVGLPAIILGATTSLQGYYLAYTIPLGRWLIERCIKKGLAIQPG